MRQQTRVHILLLLWSFMSFLCFLSWSLPWVAWVSGIHWFSWFTSFKISLFMFFTTFNIKAEINRIIFVFSLSLPREIKIKVFGIQDYKLNHPTNCGFYSNGVVQRKHWECEAPRPIREKYRMFHQSHFMRIPREPNQFSRIMMITFCVRYTHTHTHTHLLLCYFLLWSSNDFG